MLALCSKIDQQHFESRCDSGCSDGGDVVSGNTARRSRLIISAREGSYSPAARSLVVKIHAQASSPGSVSFGEATSPRMASLKDLQAASAGWFYNEDAKTVWVKFADRGAARITVAK